MTQWLADNWLAIIALLVAFLGGWPGVLQVIDRLRPPITLSGSIKFFAPTSSKAPPEYGILVALTLVNDGGKNLVWRRLSGTIERDGEEVAVTPLLIPDTMVIGANAAEPDLLTLQSIAPGTPINAFLLLAAAHEINIGTSRSVLKLRFELESGRTVTVALPFEGVHPLRSGETFPTHSFTYTQDGR